LTIQTVANLTVMLEVLSAFLHRLRRVGDGVLPVFASDGDIALDAAHNRVCNFTRLSRFAAAYKKANKSEGGPRDFHWCDLLD
jgi:hypothetical protein